MGSGEWDRRRRPARSPSGRPRSTRCGHISRSLFVLASSPTHARSLFGEKAGSFYPSLRRPEGSIISSGCGEEREVAGAEAVRPTDDDDPRENRRHASSSISARLLTLSFARAFSRLIE